MKGGGRDGVMEEGTKRRMDRERERECVCVCEMDQLGEMDAKTRTSKSEQ